MSVFPRIALTALDNIARPVIFMDSMRIASAIPGAIRSATASVASGVRSLFANPVEGYELAIKALLLQVIFLLLQNRTPDGKRSVDTANASEKLKTVLDYIHLHYAEPLTVAGLAAQCYFSEYYFMRFFKKHMNMTVVEYLNNLRLEKAVELFEQGNTSILEVSLATGFHNLSYFHKIFKRKFHMTPREFLKKLSSF